MCPQNNKALRVNTVRKYRKEVGLIKIPLELLPIQTPVFETSDQITDVQNYLLKVGPRSKFDFNYQPLRAGQSRWQCHGGSLFSS